MAVAQSASQPTAPEYSPHGGSTNITVVVRARPLNSREVAEETRNIIAVMNNSLVVILQPTVAKNDFLRQGRVAEKRFTFDSAWGPETDQQTIYEHSTKNLIAGVLDGLNSTSFAYGTCAITSS